VTYDDGPLAGQAAVICNGSVYSIGAWSPSLIRSLLARVLHEAGIATVALSEGVRVSRRGSAEIWMNFNEEAATLPDGSVLAPVSFEFRG
jgi:beta-galactosidase